MAFYLYANNAESSLLGNVGPADTAITLPSGEGALFPLPTAGQSFMLTIEDTSGNIEIVECTSRTNDVLTVVRGREGTLARAWTAGTLIDARITAGMLAAMDWNHAGGQPDGVATLDDLGKIPIAQFDTPLQVYGDARWNAKLGYTPPQQGTGVGQTTDTLKFGWSAGAKLKLTVNAADQGNVALESWIAATAVAFAATKLNTARAIAVAGAVVGTANFDGSAGISIATTVPANAIPISGINGLQTVLNDCIRANNGNQQINANLYVTGTMTGGAVVDLSDEAIKEGIVGMTLHDAERIVGGLRPVRYHNKITGKDEFGLIVQEAENVVPELIFPVGKIRGLAYQKLTAPLLSVVQDLRRRVADLEAR
jgi:hypothetical protein